LGIPIVVNGSPVTWYSKQQNTVELLTFGSEFIAMRIAMEQVEGLRYKLQMMGIPIDGPANVYCDNQSVFKNCSVPETTLKKKHNAIAYHRTREAQPAHVYCDNQSVFKNCLVPKSTLKKKHNAIAYHRT
jgi:hypothetical protein